MRYFVIGDDGQKYGPADVPTLQNWINEGRLLPTQQVEEEASGNRIAARAVPGLIFPMPGPQQPGAPGIPQGSPYAAQPGQPYQNYPRGNPQQYSGDNGQQDVTIAWITSILGLCCCPSAIVGLIFANRAIAKGHPQGKTVQIVSIVVIVIAIGLGIVRGFMAASMINNGTIPVK